MPTTAATASALSLDSPIRSIPGMRQADGSGLRKLGVHTVRDLLLHLPTGWESFGRIQRTALVTLDANVRVEGILESPRAGMSPYRRKRFAEAKLKTADGGVLKLLWWNQPFMAKQLQQGDRVVVAGRAKVSRYGEVVIQNPRYEKLSPGNGETPQRLGEQLPKYPLTQGLKTLRVRDYVKAVLHLADELEEPLPEDVRRRHRLLPIAEAVRLAHTSPDDWPRAKERMAWQELFELQLGFLLLRRQLAVEPAEGIPYRPEIGDRFKDGLGFQLTSAQRNAARDIFRDMTRRIPMNRLLNGDVGSGKTAVAAAAVAMAHAASLQSVVMAPTEILARQHLAKFRTYLEASFPDLRVELMVSGLPAAEARRVRMSVASGHCALVVGTHALIEEKVEFAALGLAIVDEQHRFGTGQREKLRAKGRGQPHFLAMTATPIPRTLALARYGEMALSVIDELPPGRKPVETEIITPDRRQEAYDLVRSEIRAGRQAFIICPLIEESETSVARAATAEFERLASQVFPDLRLSLVHGRLRDKDSVMAAFAAGESDVLVATAVVEVGVDVPNASVIMIEAAERFGLAQLHQFRGRVGRGAAKSYCLLLPEEPSDGALEKLRLMEFTHDGFRLAEADMRLRGAGELLGSRQHGLTDQAMAALQNPRLLDEVRLEAEATVVADPELEHIPALRAAVLRRLESTSLS